MKNKKRFIFFIILYVIGYLFFCIYGGINNRINVSDAQSKWPLLFSNMPTGVIKLSMNLNLWITISFFLILFILWQTNLTDQKLNRTGLIACGVHIVITGLSFGIVEWLVGRDGLVISITIIVEFIVIVSIAVILTYFINKKQGTQDSYIQYMDIMTEEEFLKWQEKKKKR